MAYSLGDPFRTLRLVLRTNGIALGLLGLALLLAGPRLLAALGFVAEGPMLPFRLAGAGLVGVGALLLGTALRTEIDQGLLIPCILLHALLALVLLVGYLRGEIVIGNLFALAALLLIFLICLVGALAPLRYFGPEYRL